MTFQALKSTHSILRRPKIKSETILSKPSRTSNLALLVRVVLPAAWPRIFAALRVALPISLITTFTAEMVGGGGGMGATLMYSKRFFESPTVFAYIPTMLAVGLLLDAIMLRI
jgi:ABC-type nitrate/sulfonate/bicarbonate transport system permease component